MGLEPVLATLVTLLGIALTSAGVITHVGPAVAPGALLTLVGGGWLGVSLARRNVRLLPGAQIAQTHSTDDVAAS